MITEQIQLAELPLPATVEAERLVLADVCLRGELFPDIQPIVHPDMFTSPARRSVWETFTEEYNKGNGLTFANLQPKLGTAFKTEIVPAYAHTTGDPVEMQAHAINLRDGAAKRRAYLAALSFLQNAILPTTTEQDILTAVETFTHSVEGPAPLQGEIQLADAIFNVKADIEKTVKAIKQGKNVRIPTGFAYIDEALNGGFKAGQLVILAARPSVGKTAVMLHFAKAAAKAGNPVQVFSLEMPASELAERMLYSTGEVRPYQVNFGTVNPDAMGRAEAQLSPLPLFINDFSRSLDEIVSRMTQAVKKNRCKVAFIDYLGLFYDALNFGSAALYQVIGRITGTLKAVAKRLEIPIVVLCQLNRDAARNGRPPELFDLRDSGSIEQDADTVLMLHPEVDPTGLTLNIYLRKNRSGKKDITFRVVPNDTFSAFQEKEPALPPGTVLTLPEKPASKPLYEDAKEETINDDLPF